jgi:hypothetical protein
VYQLNWLLKGKQPADAEVAEMFYLKGSSQLSCLLSDKLTTVQYTRPSVCTKENILLSSV